MLNINYAKWNRKHKIIWYFLELFEIIWKSSPQEMYKKIIRMVGCTVLWWFSEKQREYFLSTQYVNNHNKKIMLFAYLAEKIMCLY